MADPRFYTQLDPLSLKEVAALSGAAISDSATSELLVSDVAPLGEATAGKLSYADSEKTLNALPPGAIAGAIVIVQARHSQRAGALGAITLEHAAPRLAFSRIAARLFAPRGFAPGAPIHPGARIAADAQLAPGVVIGDGAVIGEGVRIGPNAAIGPGCHVGRGSVIGAHVSLACTDIGECCNILAGAVIGESGFGVAVSGEDVVDVPHLGSVVLGDRVTIGANSTIDRGVFGATQIGAGCKIDNLCHIAHNARIGEACLMPAFTGISGSTQIGTGVMFGARVGVADHVVIGSGARVGANSAVMNDVPSGETWAGAPAQPIRQHMREIAELRRMVRNKSKARSGGGTVE